MTSANAPRVTRAIDVKQLPDADLLAIVLDGAAPSQQARSSAASLTSALRRQGRVRDVIGLTATNMLPRRWAEQLCAFNELLDRNPGYDDQPAVRSFHDAHLLVDHLRGSVVEIVATLLLDTERRPLGVRTVAMGTVHRVRVAPRDILGPALREHAASIVVVHTHGSGDPTPSQPDVMTTGVLRDAANVVGIELLDHIILASRRSYSFAERQGWHTWSDS